MMSFHFVIVIFFIPLICSLPFGCPDGEEMKDGACKRCDDGMFRSGNMTVCRIFKTCDIIPQVIDFEGNSTHDVVCRCNDTRFPIIVGPTCFPNCSAGYYFYGKCVSCPVGKWKNKTGPEECSSCTQCNRTLLECNSTQDTVCDFSPEPEKDIPSTYDNNESWRTILIVVVVVVVVLVAMISIISIVCYKRRKTLQASSGSDGQPLRNPTRTEPLNHPVSLWNCTCCLTCCCNQGNGYSQSRHSNGRSNADTQCSSRTRINGCQTESTSV